MSSRCAFLGDPAGDIIVDLSVEEWIVADLVVERGEVSVDEDGFSSRKGDELLVEDRDTETLTVTHHYDIMNDEQRLSRRLCHILHNSSSISLAFSVSEFRLIISSRSE